MQLRAHAPLARTRPSEAWKKTFAAEAKPSTSQQGRECADGSLWVGKPIDIARTQCVYSRPAFLRAFCPLTVRNSLTPQHKIALSQELCHLTGSSGDRTAGENPLPSAPRDTANLSIARLRMPGRPPFRRIGPQRKPAASGSRGRSFGVVAGRGVCGQVAFSLLDPPGACVRRPGSRKSPAALSLLDYGVFTKPVSLSASCGKAFSQKKHRRSTIGFVRHVW